MMVSTLSGTLLPVAVAILELACRGQEPDWYAVDREVTTLLWTSNMPIAQLVSRVSAQPAQDGPAAMLKLCALMRAGMNEQAVVALRELKGVCPKLSNSEISTIYYAACDQEEAWDIAQAVVEVFAESVTDVTLENRLLKHWLDSGRSFEQIDQWFAARPPGIDSFWIKERFRFARIQGRGEELAKQLTDGVRRHPRDVTNAIVFLDALLYAGQTAENVDLSWFEGLIKPQRALDAKALAERLDQLENWRAALTYFQQAIAIPLTDAEIQDMGRMRQIFTEPEQLRAEVAVTVREAMAECLLKLGQAQAAQQKLVEAADIREQHNLRPNALLAGRVQAESGRRTIEPRLTEAEKKSENEPEYWRERAMYFRGRQESDQEEQALRKALSLTKPKPRPEHASKGYADLRAMALADYVDFLARHGRAQEAVALLHQEITDAPATTVSSEKAAHLLAFDFNKQINAEDAVFWNWLANRPAWGFTEERLLWRMLERAADPALAVSTPIVPPTPRQRTPEKVPNERLHRAFTRAETLVESGGANRAYTLGWIMNRMGFPKRSLPLLKAAVEKATDEELKQRASFALLESYLDRGAWKEAEAIFPEASRELTTSEIPQWYSRLALIAARDGSKADALRLWHRTANFAPTAVGGLTQLASLGLRDELVAFYRAMQKEMPGSHAPVRALDLLDATAKNSAGR